MLKNNNKKYEEFKKNLEELEKDYDKYVEAAGNCTNNEMGVYNRVGYLNMVPFIHGQIINLINSNLKFYRRYLKEKES